VTVPIGRVLCVSTSLGTRGGISSYVRMLADTELWARWQTEHVATHRNGSTVDKIGAFLQGIGHFGWALLRRRPDVVHLHMGAYGSFVRKAALVWLAAAARVPVLVHVHGSDFDLMHDRLPRPLQRIIRATLHRAAVVVALGDRWADRLLIIAPNAHVVTVPNAVRMPPAPALAAQPRPPGRPVHVVFLGEIGERKGAFTLLETWAKLAAEPDLLAGARLTMAGDREAARARRLIEELSISDSAQVRSWLAPADVAQLLAEADVFVLPSLSEGQPIALLEAMANGLCVVASDVGGIPEMVEPGRSGLLVPAGDPDALGAALRRVLSDVDLRAALGAAARERVLDRFDLDAVWRRFDDLYRQVSRR
jgi:glycosyltransferase involved in cell wall biosynthesis